MRAVLAGRRAALRARDEAGGRDVHRLPHRPAPRGVVRRPPRGAPRSCRGGGQLLPRREQDFGLVALHVFEWILVGS